VTPLLKKKNFEGSLNCRLPNRAVGDFVSYIVPDVQAKEPRLVPLKHHGEFTPSKRLGSDGIALAVNRRVVGSSLPEEPNTTL
jgi:hypothetical protein